MGGLSQTRAAQTKIATTTLVKHATRAYHSIGKQPQGRPADKPTESTLDNAAGSSKFTFSEMEREKIQCHSAVLFTWGTLRNTGAGS